MDNNLGFCMIIDTTIDIEKIKNNFNKSNKKDDENYLIDFIINDIYFDVKDVLLFCLDNDHVYEQIILNEYDDNYFNEQRTGELVDTIINNFRSYTFDILKDIINR